MAGYEIVFDGEAGSHVPELAPGQTVEIGGVLWHVERIDDGRIHVSQHHGDVAAHTRPQVALAPPSSFESELVYTLNDLASRMSTLASALNAYWGRATA